MAFPVMTLALGAKVMTVNAIHGHGGGERGGITPLLKAKFRVPLPAGLLFSTPPLLQRNFFGIFLKTDLKVHKIALKFAKKLTPKKLLFWALFHEFLSSISPFPPPEAQSSSPPWSQNLCLRDRFLPPSCRQPPCPSMGGALGRQGLLLSWSSLAGCPRQCSPSSG